MEKLEESDIIREFFRGIRTNIELNKKIKEPKTILITSIDRGDGKSYITSNLAISYANIQKKVLIIDTVIKEGIQNEIFKIDSPKGLSDILTNEKYEVSDYINNTYINNVDIICSGKELTKIADLITLSKLKILINKLKDMYDVILFDGTTSIENETLTISSQVDATIIVVKYGKTKLRDLEKNKKNIEKVGGKISGVIINNLPKNNIELKKRFNYRLKKEPKIRIT
ncbi:MAG: CpsD/CapB family tyrosine-protein kinase [Clostridia bacterium]|jgi:capsular exopolysaccharide synthesis family protein|nr:CpsD/CapB family tyrosine-protein kinase [Clostridia bacterium]